MLALLMVKITKQHFLACAINKFRYKRIKTFQINLNGINTFFKKLFTYVFKNLSHGF